MSESQKQALAEFVGTFTLTFIGAGAGAMAGSNGGGIVSVALAHGIALLVIVYSIGAISGAHVNPAVTFGLAITGHIDWGKAVLYWVAQIVGAIVAAYLLLYLVGAELLTAGATIGKFTQGTEADPVKVIIIEAVLTFFLLIAVFSSGVFGRNGNVAGIAIGLVLTMDILFGGSLTGASMNPARTVGPAVALGDPSYVWMYFVGPLLGGAAGALLYNSVFLPAQEQAPLRAAEPKDKKNRR